jgi:hypothetical protein
MGVKPCWTWSLALAGAVACGGPARPAATPSASGGPRVTPAPRTIQVEGHRVVVEGRWHPIEPSPSSPAVPNAVRIVCLRAERSCREELTYAPTGRTPLTEALDYRVREWTNERLLAVRRGGGREFHLRVSLIGAAAVKVAVKGASDGVGDVAWRLE